MTRVKKKYCSTNKRHNYIIIIRIVSYNYIIQYRTDNCIDYPITIIFFEKENCKIIRKLHILQIKSDYKTFKYNNLIKINT